MERGGSAPEFFDLTRVLSNELVPCLVRKCGSGAALDGISNSPPLSATPIRHDCRCACRRANTHRTRTARHSTAELARTAVSISGSAQHASGEDSGRDTNSGWRNQQKDRKSTRLNSSHLVISYAVFCLKKNNHT